MVEAEVPTRNQVRLCPLCFRATQPKVPSPQPTSTQPQGGIWLILEPQEFGRYGINEAAGHPKKHTDTNPEKAPGSLVLNFHVDAHCTDYYGSEANCCPHPLAEHGTNL